MQLTFEKFLNPGILSKRFQLASLKMNAANIFGQWLSSTPKKMYIQWTRFKYELYTKLTMKKNMVDPELLRHATIRVTTIKYCSLLAPLNNCPLVLPMYSGGNLENYNKKMLQCLQKIKRFNVQWVRPYLVTYFRLYFVECIIFHFLHFVECLIWDHIENS